MSWGRLAALGSLVAIVLVVVLGMTVLGGGASPTASPQAIVSPSTPPAVTPTPEPTAAPTPTPDPLTTIPIVPVADWRSTADAITGADVAAIANGKSPRWKAIEVVADEQDAVLASLGGAVTSGAALGEKVVTAPDAATLMTDLAAHRDRLAFMRADQVGPGVRALGWNGASLFGIHRLQWVADWTLTARLPAVPPDAGSAFVPYDPATTATMFAAGDLGYDRTIALVVLKLGFGVDYPYDGGTARITQSTCCSSRGWPVPTIVSTGNAGAVRDLITTADLALANSEEPTPDKWVYHDTGTVFTGNPALLAGVANAGFDLVGCANNHIGDAGRAGIMQTLASLAKVKVAAFGCGKDLDAARVPAVYDLNGTKIAILAYDSIAAKAYGATATTIGSAPLTEESVQADVAAARAAGAQVVVVFPHWGVEYTFGPSAYQSRFAHLMIDAGADMVIGNHPHWVQSVEIYKGRPIWYALGNFTFDQSWSESTLEGVSLEITFRGGALVQARMNPHVLVKASQPNLLDADSGYSHVLGPVFKASGSLLTW